MLILVLLTIHSILQALSLHVADRASVMQMGMPHRGRLNLLCNLLHKPAGQLFGELLQAVSEFHIGDVQYHQGQASTLAFPRTVSLNLFLSLHQQALS